MNLLGFLGARIQVSERNQFFACDQFPLDDEAIADLAIRAMLLVMQNHSRTFPGVTAQIDDYAPLVFYGVRFPWKDRIALSGSIDLVNDELPSCAVIGLTRHKKGTYAQAVYATRYKPHKRIAALAGAIATYRVGWISGHEGLSRSLTCDPSKDLESVVTPFYAGVLPNGQCVSSTLDGQPTFEHAKWLSYVVGLHNDARYFWNVQAAEEWEDGMTAKANFSIDAEYVKSLFYARSLPVTKSGRMRPILHWVNAHKRRLKQGIDIDIAKHLRGISEFDMHTVRFSITRPRKQTRSRVAAAVTTQ